MNALAASEAIDQQVTTLDATHLGSFIAAGLDAASASDRPRGSTPPTFVRNPFRTRCRIRRDGYSAKRQTLKLGRRPDPRFRDSALLVLPRAVRLTPTEHIHDAVERFVRRDVQGEHAVLRQPFPIHAKASERFKRLGQVACKRTTTEANQPHRDVIRWLKNVNEHRM